MSIPSTPRLLKLITAVSILLCIPCGLSAAPQQLLEVPLESPEKEYSANVEWDTAGFIGRITMVIYESGSRTARIELPQIKPSPAYLQWITNSWVACESFIAERGAAFFYVNAPRKKGYMIEIFAPEKKGDWLISYTTNDSVSSDTINTISKKHSSLFPILLRDLPEEGLSYLSPDFPYLLSDAVDSFVEWRKRQKFTEMKFLTEMSENPKTGRLVIAMFDKSAEIVYFPQGTTTTREMLALTQRQRLPDKVQHIIKRIDPPQLSIEWTGDEGHFHVLASREDDRSSATELIAGRFENISDSPYTGPGVKDLLNAAKDSDSSDSDDEKKSEDSDSGKGSSKSKEPSRSD